MKDKFLSLFTVLLFLTGLGSIAWVMGKSYFMQKEISEVGETNCVTQRVERLMNDDSAAKDLNKGDRYQVLLNYYRCNPVQRLDLISFKSSSVAEPTVKRVQALPGDEFSVIETDTPGEFQLKVNGTLVMGRDKPYFFRSQGISPLKSLEMARQGRLGPNEYLLLSDTSPGFADSTSLGVIKNTAFEGRVLPLP